ncbi:MAG: 4Fe-4S dicluster domain-containing protein [Alphaproteobacteria bacterium]|nr:4Fe-4S dicluster domain-containing protein [Alphaproteobacteria bacterium]MBT4016835.1 4Fe-4S dicluster domain-containing protein [Alphaproteobacteria bacterium]MBT5161027.1 4Fe-4S dicluster domain-containing protein [Alphaproteobacteria bacterium]MBT5918558.1 4Fe-4S dicluster domain-containing protein [Alphaproteobacteria bacterium]MBT6386001.1 4Fe-4S dicluster domain-containing protein [Alphaproteobacteria bacterium]
MAYIRGKNGDVYQPSDMVKEVWPDVSGNDVNGLGVEEKSKPVPVFWRTDGSIAHHDLLMYFYTVDQNDPRIINARKFREANKLIPISEVAETKADMSPEDMSAALKEAAQGFSADDVGITAWREEWTYSDRDQPLGPWTIVLAIDQDFDEMNKAPDLDSYVEVVRQYARAGKVAIQVANWIREQGYSAEEKTGPMSEDVIMIPAAIEAGIGELGKHGSMIHHKMGSNFRLSMVTTDMPLAPDTPKPFGADDFCASCQVCKNACPPDAIFNEKQMVRGNEKWFVDFDKCIPYFVDNQTCGICLVVCPWSRPGVADNLLTKMARRRAQAAE